MIKAVCTHENRKKNGVTKAGSIRYRCKDCGKSWTESTDLLNGMRIGLDRACQILELLCEGMSVRATEEAVTLYQSPAASAKNNVPRPGARHERLDYLASSLSDRLDTNVKISLGARKGRVSIEFASVEDLNRIMEVLTPGSEN